MTLLHLTDLITETVDRGSHFVTCLTAMKERLNKIKPVYKLLGLLFFFSCELWFFWLPHNITCSVLFLSKEHSKIRPKQTHHVSNAFTCFKLNSSWFRNLPQDFSQKSLVLKPLLFVLCHTASCKASEKPNLCTSYNPFAFPAFQLFKHLFIKGKLKGFFTLSNNIM